MKWLRIGLGYKEPLGSYRQGVRSLVSNRLWIPLCIASKQVLHILKRSKFDP